jgi:hypothetical protein
VSSNNKVGATLFLPTHKTPTTEHYYKLMADNTKGLRHQYLHKRIKEQTIGGWYEVIFHKYTAGAMEKTQK